MLKGKILKVALSGEYYKVFCEVGDEIYELFIGKERWKNKIGDEVNLILRKNNTGGLYLQIKK